MSGSAEAEAPRPRPLSAGLWTLFSWLRREDSSSSESISSAGSDRTAASFAFLASPPTRVQTSPQPPPSPPSDTYKKRVRDRNLRRQYDRNLTLHSKYGLLRFDGSYDAFSLPFTRRNGDLDDRQEREKRATSECGPLRAAYVPGKRRAPLPPVRSASTAGTTSLTRRHARKRPAPLPPLKLKDSTKENKPLEQEKVNIIVKMNSKSDEDRHPLSTSNAPMGCKSEKYSKKESKDKPRTEKSFLKQIFENRKRNSAIESFPGKILPSISELDKQAAEIIESCKLRALEQNNEFVLSGAPSTGNTWFCTRCLRKYNSTVVTCLYCLPEQRKLTNGVNDTNTKAGNASSIYTQTRNEVSPNVANTSRHNGVDIDEKQKLKEMLKEMKDSLPKRPKHEKNYEGRGKNRNTDVDKSNEVVLETPTLRIGSIVHSEENVSPSTSQEKFSKPTEPTKQISVNNRKSNNATETVIITQPVVLIAPPLNNNLQVNNNTKTNVEGKNTEPGTPPLNKDANNSISSKDTKSVNVTNDNKFKDDLKAILNERIDVHTPLRISSLFNPVYIPKNEVQTPRSIFFKPQPQANIELKPNASAITSNEVQLASSVSPSTSQYKSTKAPSSSVQMEVIDGNEIISKDKQQSLFKNTSVVPKSMILEKIVSPTTKLSPPTQKKGLNDLLAVVSTGSEKQLSNMQKPSNSNIARFSADQHSRRRDLINQLEQSIAKGDERAAAEAAVKLAQLKLSCSVLSFSSQIVGESSNIANPATVTTTKTDDSKSKTPPTQSSSTSTAAPERSINPNKTNDPKSILHVQQHSSPAEGNKVATSTSKINDLKSNAPHKSTSPVVGLMTTNATCDPKTKKASTQPSVKVNTSVQSMEIVSSKDKCKQNKEKGVGSKNEVVAPSSSSSKQESLKTELLHKTITKQQKPIPAEPSTSRLPANNNGNNLASIEVWVEDREATRGPVRLRIPRQAMMGDLRHQAEATLGLAARMQRWIVGHALCTNDATPLVALAGPELAAPFYLCLVQSETNPESSPGKAEANEQEVENEKAGNFYSELVQLEQRALVPNAEQFECGVCMEECAIGGGAVLRDCLHAFCRECISDLVRHCEEPVVSCPAMGCPGVLQEREIRGVVSTEEYERWLARGLAAAESGTRNAFHCRTRDCTGWALCEPGVRRFPCPVCKHTNCVPCQAIHEGETCEQHRVKLQEAAKTIDTNQTDEGTRALLDTLITKGEALQCPECSAIITKKWGCDWVKCSACKTEICWVTRGRRWGPGGRGDTTGGCRCGVDGKRCHPSCGYCH